MKSLGKKYKKIHTCGSKKCRYDFEEENLGNIFVEIKNDPDIALHLIEMTYMAFRSGHAHKLTEPFPSFLLLDRELRPRTGDLEYIK